MRDLEKCVGSLEEKSGAVVDDYGGRLNPAVKERWLSAYKDSFTSIEDIPGCINLSEIEKNLIRQVTATYQMRIPHYYFSLVQHSANPKDPIWRQCVPSVEEIREDIDGKIDPLGEEKFTPTPYLVHRYPDRVLLLVTGQCFMHCRHCTRKRLWKDKNSEPILKDIEEALDYVKKNRHIREVIVSGGDPLTLSTEKLDRILLAISLIESVEVIRIGTRAPVVFPQRINDRLCAVLSKYDNLWVNVQFNHPREITAQAVTACQKIQQCGIPISNQSVLLKGINDDQQTMTELCRKLQSVRIRPYYLFECDPVVGASHFRTPVSKGIELIKKMRGYTSGMCIPNFVVDGTDGKGKVPLAPNYLVSESEKGMLLRNYKDELFLYPDPGLRVKVSDRQETSLGVCNIGIIFNLKKNDCSGDEEEEYDEIATIESIKTEIEKLGFKSMLFEHIDSLADDLRRQKPDFVLNIAEGLGAGRSRESEVPCLLESLGIPYSGSDPISLGITLDKYFTGTMLKASAIP
ncbi:MAG: KamA family radical SAM protein, partial [Candidatus Omnitrophica bacterium]|nr:KamA family radical SAM protein [Candidatus Omnitrophota bacterium]